ncbi:MAG: TonB C-terminal domain-containing protein [candidate division WOR-3 bacterium]|nr:TonB C-terminal domain-containing protein [candidate division WOR-3 bacterium]MCX7837179.1 TonB C-terminal domain-containing protein [candidate division WOR-3 bacterium]MDW8114459.1 energy transducer TonB [candidate division WOR-3 bacterium]
MNNNFKDYFYSFLFHLFFFAFFSFLPMFKKTKNIDYPVILEVSIAPKISEENIEKKSDVAVQKEGIKKEEKKEIKKDTLKAKASKKEDVIKSKGFSLKTEGGVVSSFYLNIVLNKIAENWYNPYANTNLNLKAIIFFKITKEGKIGEVKVEKSSGKEDYDEYCKRAVLLTKNLPPLPDDFQADVLKIHLEFEYKP